MSSKMSLILVAVGMFSVLLLSGCGPDADLSLKFPSDRVTAYKATAEVTKLFRFEQPNLDKLKEEQTKTLIEMDFTQTIQAVDADGNATAQITINDLKVEMINKNKSQLSFDSQKESDKDAPLATLLGKSYTLQITPSGQVKTLDTKNAMAAVTSAYEKKIVKSLLDPKEIAERHQIAALPKDLADELSVGDTWSKVVASPPGLLAPKSYEKTYTLTAIDAAVATVQMTAGESAVPAEGGSQAAGGMGMFAKMFDNQDDYTGTLKFDLETGEVLSSVETLISTYTAQEMPENGDPDKGPDILTMQFINRIQLEKLN
ncbi:MAG: hypothetical protein H8E62_04385 [Planctomycetes bacterium]|nr:hypothetical protein [Planctomycetota bacterium]